MLFWEFEQAVYVYDKWFKFANVYVERPNFLALLWLMVNLIETHSSAIHCVVLWDCITSQATIMTYIEVTRKKYRNINSTKFE